MMRYNSFTNEMQKRFGKKMYKLSFDAGMTCPNRDGTVGVGGCIFCGEGGSGDFAIKIDPNSLTSEVLDEKINQAIAMVSKKINPQDCGFIAYFQSYTNTYASPENLKNLYFSIINHPKISALSIATRPDCLGTDIISLLSNLNRIKPVWVELGLQTIHERSGEFINRCYGLTVFEEAIKNLRSINIDCIVHVILGIPGETREMMLDTIRYLAAQDIQGIKLSMLHVLRGTKLAEIYEKEPFPVFSLEEYVDLITECLRIIPENIVIHRLTGDGNKKNLIAPSWSGDKKRVLNAINARIGRIDLRTTKEYGRA